MAFSQLPGTLTAPSSITTSLPNSLVADTNAPPAVPSQTRITIYPSSSMVTSMPTTSASSMMYSGSTHSAVPNSSQNGSSHSSSSSSGLSTGTIIAIVVIPIVVIAILGAFFFWFCARRRRRQRESSDSTTQKALVEGGAFGSASTGTTGATGNSFADAGAVREKPLPHRPARPSAALSPTSVAPAAAAAAGYNNPGPLPAVARSPAFPHRAFEPPPSSFYSESSTPPPNNNGVPGGAAGAVVAPTSQPLTAANLTQYQSSSQTTSGAESRASPFDDPVGGPPSRSGTGTATHDAESVSDTSAPTTHALRHGMPGEATRSLTGQPLSSPPPPVQSLMYGVGAVPSASASAAAAAAPMGTSPSQSQPSAAPSAHPPRAASSSKRLPTTPPPPPPDPYRLPSLTTEGNYPFSPASTHPGHISTFEGAGDDTNLESMSPVSDMTDDEENPEHVHFPGMPPPMPRGGHYPTSPSSLHAQ